MADVTELATAGREWCKNWFRSAEAFLLGSLVLMTLLGVSLPYAMPSHVVFWLLFVPATLWLVVKNAGWRTLWRQPALRWAGGLLLLYAISVLWSVDTTWAVQTEVVSESLQTALFVAGLFLALRAEGEQHQHVGRLLIILCVIGTLVSLTAFYGYAAEPISRRLFGDIFLLDYPTYSGPLLLGCLMAAGLLLEAQPSGCNGVWLVVGFAFVGLFLFFTQTRGALISFGCLALLWGSVFLGVRKTLCLVAIVMAVGVLLIRWIPTLEHAWLAHLSRGLSGRGVIWENALRSVMDAPLLGHGAACIFSESGAGKAVFATLRHVIAHPHGLPFSIPFYLGVVGVALWLGFLVAVVRAAWRQHSRTARLGLLALPCILLMTSSEVHTLIASVGTIWWTWWLPTIVMVALADSVSANPAATRG
jgi:hypothetical protein